MITGITFIIVVILFALYGLKTGYEAMAKCKEKVTHDFDYYSPPMLEPQEINIITHDIKTIDGWCVIEHNELMWIDREQRQNFIDHQKRQTKQKMFLLYTCVSRLTYLCCGLCVLF